MAGGHFGDSSSNSDSACLSWWRHTKLALNMVSSYILGCCRETGSLKLAKLGGCTFVNQYVVIKYLGRGACGRVFLCMDMGDNRLYAVKVRQQHPAAILLKHIGCDLESPFSRHAMLIIALAAALPGALFSQRPESRPESAWSIFYAAACSYLRLDTRNLS